MLNPNRDPVPYFLRLCCFLGRLTKRCIKKALVVAMHVFDVLEAWLVSMEINLSSSGVIARFERSPTDRPNPSCGLNLRRNDRELDLVLWESGEAELVFGEIEGAVSQIHFDDVRNRANLAEFLSKLVEFIALIRSE